MEINLDKITKIAKENHRLRYETNKEILEILKHEIEKRKDLRFIQLLWALNIVNKEDRFYEESIQTLDKIKLRLILAEETKIKLPQIY